MHSDLESNDARQRIVGGGLHRAGMQTELAALRLHRDTGLARSRATRTTPDPINQLLLRQHQAATSTGWPGSVLL